MDPCRGRVRSLHDHARQHDRERDAALDLRDLDIGVSELAWVVTAYALSFAEFMLTGGKLADMFGRRRIFFLGLALFTLSIIAPTFPARERGTALGI